MDLARLKLRKQSVFIDDAFEGSSVLCFGESINFSTAPARFGIVFDLRIRSSLDVGASISIRIFCLGPLSILASVGFKMFFSARDLMFSNLMLSNNQPTMRKHARTHMHGYRSKNQSVWFTMNQS